MTAWGSLWRIAAITLGAAFASAAAEPLPFDEIRSVLRQQLIDAPAEPLLQLPGGDLDAELARLDAYARHFPAGAPRTPLDGGDAWTGIGAELFFEGGEAWLSPYQGGPAAWVGVPDRVQLLEIDGQSVAGLDADTLVARLRGPSGSQVRLSLMGQDGRRWIAHIEREPFRPLHVEVLGQGGGPVLRVREFVAGLTRPALHATLDFLRSHAQREDDVLVFDLRASGGGDLYEAFDLAGLFLPGGTLLGTLLERGGIRHEVRATAGPKLHMPVLVLIGPHTASAAEIFAGALQHHRRATLVGQTSFGKCSSQTDVRLSDGSVLRFTNREILLPDGRSCSGAGLVPDLAVDADMLGDFPRLVQHALASTPIR